MELIVAIFCDSVSSLNYCKTRANYLYSLLVC